MLHVSLTSTRQKSPLQSFPVRPTMPSARAQRHRDGVVDSQPSSLPRSGSPSKLFTAVLELQKDPRFGHLTKDIHFIPLTHPAMLQEYVASTIGPNVYAWLSETVSTVAVKAVLISFDFSGRKNAHYQQRCGEISKLGAAVQENFAELQRTGHPKWKEVDLNQEIGIWKRDACSRVVRRVSQQAPQTADDLLKAITDILKGKGQPR